MPSPVNVFDVIIGLLAQLTLTLTELVAPAAATAMYFQSHIRFPFESLNLYNFFVTEKNAGARIVQRLAKQPSALQPL